MTGLKTPPLFGDGMVIQRDVPFSVWGSAGANAKVKAGLSLASSRISPLPVQADGAGSWRITFDPVPAGGPFSLDIESEGEKIAIGDIYSGDLWLCAGQSNMEMMMERLRDDYPEEWMAQEFPPIRQFKVPQEWDFKGPRADLEGGAWIGASKESLGQFSGAAWFFAKNICEKYQTPVGLVAAAWGGTPIEAWMSREALAGFPEKIAQGERYADPALCEKIARENAALVQGWEARIKSEDRGLGEEWQQPHIDISHWGAFNMPGAFAAGGLEGFCGVLWLCREFEISADFIASDMQFWLGTITDADTVYINGVEIGSTAYRYPPRKYRIPDGLLHEGKNRAAIRVTCISGDGGITCGKPFHIFSEQGRLELAGEWRWRVGAQAGSPRAEEFFFQRQPCGPYNAMIAPVLKLPFKGVIWYQGESNERNPGEYAALFKAMIQGWRRKSERESGRECLPFLFVQLPIFGDFAEDDEESPWALVREAQEEALSLPHTGMAAGLDLGEWNDLHPVNKKDVGWRLFLAAEKAVFGGENASPGPMIRSVERRGGQLLLKFDNCGSGLRARRTLRISISLGSMPGGTPGGMPGGTLVRRPMEITGPDTAAVDISDLKNPEKVIYAWADNPLDRHLCNSDGLPAIPFRRRIG